MLKEVVEICLTIAEYETYGKIEIYLNPKWGKFYPVLSVSTAITNGATSIFLLLR